MEWLILRIEISIGTIITVELVVVDSKIMLSLELGQKQQGEEVLEIHKEGVIEVFNDLF